MSASAAIALPSNLNCICVSLENQLQCDLSDSSGLGAADDTEGTAIDVHCRIAEIRMVERVVKLNAKLSLNLFRDSELLEHTQVEVCVARSAERILRQISSLAGS